MDTAREQGSSGERHYRVVRFFSDFSTGMVREVVASDLTREEAEEVFNREQGLIPGEDLVIQDQDLIGIDSEVKGDDWTEED